MSDNYEEQQGLDLSDPRLSNPTAGRNLIDQILGRPSENKEDGDDGQQFDQGPNDAIDSSPSDQSQTGLAAMSEDERREYEALKREVEQRKIADQQQGQSRQFQEFQRAWNDLEAKVWSDVQEVDDPNAQQKAIREFYHARRQNESQVLGGLVATMHLENYKNQARIQHGLTAEEMQMIRNDPRFVDEDLQHVLKLRDRTNQVAATGKQAKAQAVAQSRTRSGVNAMGGAGAVGSGAPTPRYKPGSREHLLDLLTS